MTLCYVYSSCMHRSVPCSALTRETSSCSKWEQIKEPHRENMQRMREVWTFIPELDSSIESLLSQKTLLKRRQKECKTQRVQWTDTKEARDFLLTGSMHYELMETGAGAQDKHGSVPERLQNWKKRTNALPKCLTHKQSLIDNYLQIKKLVLYKGVLLEKQTTV